MPFKSIIDSQYRATDYFPIDLSINNSYWQDHDVSDIAVFEEYLGQQREITGKFIAHGGYLEQRALYRNSPRFQTGEVRDIHMGLDLWAPAGTTILAPFDGIVHSFDNHKDAGNYGPTLILEHEVDGKTLYTLYGHLSANDLEKWHVGLRFRESEIIATLGESHENGGYSPHLHFQVMTTMKDYRGDFPGVASQDQLAGYELIILDPNSFIF